MHTRLRLVFICAMFALYAPAWAAGQGGGHSGDHGGGQGHSHAGELSAHSKTPGDLLAHNTKLAASLSGLLPASTNLQTAALGFKNLGQFVAAVHVSHNLGISFSDLKAKIMSGDTLGQAIHSLRPNVDADNIAHKALVRANIQIRKEQGES